MAIWPIATWKISKQLLRIHHGGAAAVFGCAESLGLSYLNRATSGESLQQKLLVRLLSQRRTLASLGICNTRTEFRRPMPITARWRCVRPIPHHGSAYHRRLQITEINKQRVQVLHEIYESCIMRIVHTQVVPETALDEEVRQIAEPEKAAKREFFDQQWKNILRTNSFEALL